MDNWPDKQCSLESFVLVGWTHHCDMFDDQHFSKYHDYDALESRLTAFRNMELEDWEWNKNRVRNKDIWVIRMCHGGAGTIRDWGKFIQQQR